MHALDQPGGDYNVLPYVSMPYALTEPGRTAALAVLFGLEPPQLQDARVLEIGCASGGNIIPLAVQYPQARFLGIDLSARHVDDGCKHIAALGLDNIEIAQADISDFTPPDYPFDFIICHGVFSWIPPAAQEAVFRLCSATLSENGIAYISYNVYPGWHLRKIVRDIGMFHAGASGTPQLRVARTRWVLEQLAQSTDDKTPYGQLLRHEAQLNARQYDSYILGEFLASDNWPCYFHEFVHRAGEHGLAYLCEAELSASVPENLSPETAKLIRAIAGADGVAIEQYIDFFTGRAFRRSLLVKSARQDQVSRHLTPDRLLKLNISGELKLDPEPSMGKQYVLRHRDGRVFASDDPLVRQIFDILAGAYPATRTAAEIVQALAASGTAIGHPEAARILDALFKSVVTGMTTVAARPARLGRASAARPLAWRIARDDAAAQRPWTTSLTHQHVGLDKLSAFLLAQLDGVADRAALIQRLATALADGTPPDLIPAAAAPADPKARAASLVDQALLHFEKSALLDAGAP